MGRTRLLQPPFTVTDELRSRFFSNAAFIPNGCMEWQGPLYSFGYGASSILGKVFGSHVVAWRIGNGGVPVPVGMVVMHDCDNPACVNPNHLSIGTQSENMMHASAIGVLGKSRQKGEKRYNAVFTESTVLAARAMYASGVAIKDIAAKLGVSDAATRSVVRMKNWRHIAPTNSVTQMAVTE